MLTVLLVDDVPQIRDVVTTLLTDEDFSVVAFASCEEALAHLEVSLPDLLILDGRLPGMSGWECLERVRTAERTSQLPVLMLTAAPADARTHPGLDDDACTRCLVKPFDLDALLEAVHDIIETCGQPLVSA